MLPGRDQVGAFVQECRQRCEMVVGSLPKLTEPQRLIAFLIVALVGVALHAVSDSHYFLHMLGVPLMILGFFPATLVALKIYQARSEPNNMELRDTLLPSVDEVEVAFV